MKKSILHFLILIIIPFIFSCKNQVGNNSSETVENTIKEELVQNQENEVQQVQQEVDDQVYSHAAEMPRFPGCEDKDIKTIEKYVCANNRLNNYIHNRLRYPKIALNNRVEGTVTAQFVVRKDGLLEDIVILNDIGYGCGRTVLGIIESMNHMDERWVPGKNGGKAVKVRVAIPVEFRLMID